MSDTIGLEEAANLCRIDRETMRTFLANGDAPGAKIGKEWVCIRADLLEWLRDQIAAQQKQRRAESQVDADLSAAVERQATRGRKRPLPALPEPTC